MGTFDETMRRFATLADDALARPCRWREREVDVRWVIVRSLEEEHAAVFRARSAWRPTEVARILALARREFGDLCGLVVALPEATLDGVRDGEWTLRRILTHVGEIERRYAAQTFYAAHRPDDAPLRMAEGDPRLPAKDGPELAGGTDALLARLAVARESSDAALGRVPDAALDRPSDWAGESVDVRLRLHRFAAHLYEHTLQCEKALSAAGVREGQARRLVRRIWSARGELEAMDAEDALAGLDDAHAERARSL